MKCVCVFLSLLPKSDAHAWSLNSRIFVPFLLRTASSGPFGARKQVILLASGPVWQAVHVPSVCVCVVLVQGANSPGGTQMLVSSTLGYKKHSFSGKAAQIFVTWGNPSVRMRQCHGSPSAIAVLRSAIRSSAVALRLQRCCS